MSAREANYLFVWPWYVREDKTESKSDVATLW